MDSLKSVPVSVAKSTFSETKDAIDGIGDSQSRHDTRISGQVTEYTYQNLDSEVPRVFYTSNYRNLAFTPRSRDSKFASTKENIPANNVKDLGKYLEFDMSNLSLVDYSDGNYTHTLPVLSPENGLHRDLKSSVHRLHFAPFPELGQFFDNIEPTTNNSTAGEPLNSFTDRSTIPQYAKGSPNLLIAGRSRKLQTGEYLEHGNRNISIELAEHGPWGAVSHREERKDLQIDLCNYPGQRRNQNEIRIHQTMEYKGVYGESPAGVEGRKIVDQSSPRDNIAEDEGPESQPNDDSKPSAAAAIDKTSIQALQPNCSDALIRMPERLDEINLSSKMDKITDKWGLLEVGSWIQPESNQDEHIPTIDSMPADLDSMTTGVMETEIGECNDGNSNTNGSRRANSQIVQVSAEKRKGGTQNKTQKRVPSSPGDGDEDDDLNTPKRSKKTPASTARRIACPFYKKDPQLYRPNDVFGEKYRPCAGRGFPDLARLKEHLYRVHILPPTCPRCGRTFIDQDHLVNHLDAEIRCEEQAIPQVRGISPEMLTKLKRKNGRNQSNEQKWVELYHVLFPDEIALDPPSPYQDQDDDFVGFSKRELPVLLDKALDSSLRTVLDVLDPERLQAFKNLLMSEVVTCHDQLCTVYRNSQIYPPALTEPFSDVNTASSDPVIEEPDCSSNPLSRNPFFALSPHGQGHSHFSGGQSTPASSSSRMLQSSPSFSPHGTEDTQSPSNLRHKPSQDSHASWDDSGYGSISKCGNIDCPGCMNCVEMRLPKQVMGGETTMYPDPSQSTSPRGSYIDPSLLTDKTRTLLSSPSTMDMDSFINFQFPNDGTTSDPKPR